MRTIDYKQDMPPQGGYAEIKWERIPAKKYFNGITLLAGLTVSHALGTYLIYKRLCGRRDVRAEMADCRNAVEPLVTAENDRKVMRQARKNFEEEKELMKNVPGWKVGTYFGEPIFKTVDKDKWFDPHAIEHFAHNRMWDYNYRIYFHYKQ